MQLRNLGPAVAGGRVTTVNGISGKPGIYYVGTAGGGLWKTIDGGLKWTELFRHGPTASVGAVALAPSNSNDVWLGTGEANVRNDVLLGRGIFFSPDGGKTWQAKGLADAGQISKIIVNPTNPDIVYVAVLGDPWKPTKTRGVYMTTDGGKTWNKVLYVNDTTGASDIAMDPDNPNVMFAGLWTEQRRPWTQVNGSTDGGIWRSLDGGRTWKKLSNGLTSRKLSDRVGIAIAPSDPNTVYALMATKNCILWGSTDMGDSWHCISNNHAIDGRPYYFSVMAVSPNNPDTLYFCSGSLLKSIDGGKTAYVIGRGVHSDHHAIWIDPKDPERMIQGTDGGVYQSLNGGKSWRYFNNLPIAQFYTVSIRNTVPFGVCGGIQDNDAVCGPSNSLSFPNSLSRGGISGPDWWVTVVGDGQYVVPAPSDPDIIYADSQSGARMKRIDTRTKTSTMIRPTLVRVMNESPSKLKYRYNWSAPIAVSPTDPHTVYMGTNVLFKSTDGGANWQVISKDLTRNIKKHQPIAGGPVMHDISGAENTDTILSISIAPTDPKVIWVGTDDGLVWVTKDGGKHWNNVAPHLPSSVKYGRIYQIGVSPFAGDTAYITVDGHMLGDNHPYVFKTSNYGSSWQNIAHGLPKNYSAMVVRQDPNQKNLLALGTMRGLYLSFDDGNHWHAMTANLPTMAVWDLKFTKSPRDLVLATHGRGLWILDNLQALEHWGPKIANDAFHLFPASRGTEWISASSGFHIAPPPGAFVTPNPPSGPQIAYYLAQPAATASAGKKAGKSEKGKPEREPEPVTIAITDSAGNKVATIHGSGKAGINRIAWNMRYKGVSLPNFLETSSSVRRRSPTGPIALPGTYKVKVRVGAYSAAAEVHVRADPRLHTPMSTQRAALKTGLALRNETQAMLKMINQTHAVLATLGKVISSTAEADPDSAKLKLHNSAVVLKGKFDNFARRLYHPKLNSLKGSIHDISRFGARFLELYRRAVSEGAFAYLTFMGPNRAPNTRQQKFITKLQTELQQYLVIFNGKLHRAVVKFNQTAFKAGVQTLPIDTTVKVKPVRLPPSVAARG